MADSPVENPSTPDYPHEMETRVAILEHSTAELKFEIREVKAMVRDLATEMREGFRAIAAKFDATDRAIAAKFDATDRSIADMRVEMQSVRTEIQSVRTEVQGVRAEFESKIGSARNQIFTLIISVAALTIAAIGLLITFH